MSVTYAIEGLYPVRGSKGEREWQTWLRNLSEEQARSTIEREKTRMKEWLKDCFSDLRLVKVTTEVIG